MNKTQIICRATLNVAPTKCQPVVSFKLLQESKTIARIASHGVSLHFVSQCALDPHPPLIGSDSKTSVTLRPDLNLSQEHQRA